MAKGKFEYWLTEDGLMLIEAMARDGLSDEQIAKRCGVTATTLYEWKKRFPEISEALRRGKEIVDIEVENALYKKCIGYNVPVTKHFKLKEIQYDESTGKKISEVEELVEVEETMHIPADTTAQKFWLANRRPDKWREKQQVDVNADVDTDINVTFEGHLTEYVN